jgi:RNA polymerase sigma-70 factor (ECF subfamily)
MVTEALVVRWVVSTVSLDPTLEREFEARLAESATLAFRVAYGVLRHREDAEDVAQEAMAKAYREFASLQDRERFRGWLVRIAWRMAIDRRRGDKRRARREESTVAPEPPPSVEDMAITRDVHNRVWEAVDALPERLRAVVTLGAMNGHDVREVAGLLDLPEGTVKSRLHQARRMLAEKLRWLAKSTNRA